MTQRPYLAYKDSGIEWLGEVPEHWTIRPLKRDCKIRYGIGEPPKYVEEGVPLIRATNIDAGKISTNNLVFVDPNDIPESRIVWLEKGDVIVVRSGAYTGDSAPIPAEYAKSIAGFDMVVRSFSGKLDSTFLGWALLSSYLKAWQIDLEKMRAAQPHLNAEELGECLIIAPPSHEQQAIAAFLDRETSKIDALVAEQERLIELLTEKRQAVISHAVTRGLNPSAPLKDSGVEWLGEVPERWEVKRLRMIASVQTGVAKGKDNNGRDVVLVPYLRVANVQDGYLDLAEVEMIEIPQNDLPRYLLRSGDVLMNEGGDYDKLGRGHVWRGEIESCIHQNHVFAVRPRGVLSEWLNSYTSSDYGQFYFKTKSKQSTNLASISSTNLMELPLPLPPSLEQRAIVSYLDEQTAKFDALIAEARRGIELLKERRTALISAAVTGKIDVREAA